MSKRRVAAQSGVWSIVLQWSRFGLNTVVFLILARWLSLAEIGAFAVAFAPINILQKVQRSGFSESVVQGPTEPGPFTDTIFWMSLAFGLAMSLCLFGLSFVIGPLMESEASGTYLAAMAVIPALIGVATVHEGLLRQRLEIRTLALRTTASLTVASLIALWLGYAGYGGWALTALAVVNALLSSVLVVILVRWTPGGRLRRTEARKAFPIVASISTRGLANSSTMPALQLMVGLALGPAAAGAFQIAQRFLTLAATVTLTPLRFAALPVFVRARDDADRLRRVVTETAGLVSFAAAPIYFGLLAMAPTLLPLAVGEQNGTASTPVLQALLLVGGSVGLFAGLSQTMTAIGRSDVAVRWSLALFAINLTTAAIAVQYSEKITALCYGLTGYLLAPFALRLFSIHLGVSWKDISRAVFIPAVTAAAMALCILLFDRLFGDGMGDVRLLAAQFAIGVVLYLGLSLLFSRPQIMTTHSLLVALLPKRFQI